MHDRIRSARSVCLEEAIFERVYDGDTFYVTFPDWHPIVGKNIGVRIKGIDTPELRTRDEKEKALAVEAKAYVEKRIDEARVVNICNVERDKYFRLLADVYVDGISLSALLIEQGFAVPYDGGTKVNWSEVIDFDGANDE
jgi:endonuclease YncB( thermonuclease family)